MARYLLSLLLVILFCNTSNAQILDSARVKTPTIDTVILVTQQDVNNYISLREITDTVGKLSSYISIIKTAKETSVMHPKAQFETVLLLTERNEKFQALVKKPITKDDINEYLSILKITDDTIGKTNDFIKIIKSAKTRMAMAELGGNLYKVVSYETALMDAKENFRLRNLVNKVLVIKHERKMYLLKDGKTVKTFTVALGKNPVGQKEFEGDGKTPEGIYTLDWQKWNSSTFHSFHISYPNEIDLARAKTKKLTAGSYIMVHGTSKGVKKRKDWTNGCIALNNVDMAEFKKIVFQDTQIEIRK
ncbi:L,D-transpeptidase family protein [Pedobacter namyangjuensis]|uniref:L,D-transpeptidase family protein n=1 Tax=Pedobacter namyangjuensis TaxID=600626 RepID=UPI00196642BA|nr:L,D-transpeptidase family protein [Pedobacter namyangjuensis]